MADWTSGYTAAQIDEAQERYEVRFPPDLIDLLLERRPAQGYDWHTEDPRIREMLSWPFDLLLFDVENGFWWPDWGDRPTSSEERAEALRAALKRVSRLIPLLGHRFLPETPSEEGNPVFSMHGFDTIYYGRDLTDYFQHEFSVRLFDRVPVRQDYKFIPFWSDLVEKPEVRYAFYEAEVSNQR
jgi:hypothetical protein